MSMWKICINDSEDLDFVLACLFSQAIDRKELNLWAEEVVKTSPIENIPSYIFELVDFEDSLLRLDEIIGFTPDTSLSKKDELAIYGIAFLRGVDVYDSPVTKSKAIQSLKESPEIYKRFKKFFPFIELPEL